MAFTVGSGLLQSVDSVVMIGGPLWIVSSTSAPRSAAGVIVVCDTVASSLLQAPIGHRLSSLRSAQRVAVLAVAPIALGCSSWLVASWAPPGVSVLLLVVGAVALAAGCAGQSLANWYASQEIAPEQSKERYLAVYSLSGTVQRVIGPTAALGLLAAQPEWGWAVVVAAVVTVTAANVVLAARLAGVGARRPAQL